MAEGIVFGGFLLSEEQFKIIFKEWYEKRGRNFKRAIDSLVRDYLPFKTPKECYIRWEQIMKTYFGNTEIDLIAVVDFNDKRQITTRIREQEVLTNQGISVKKTTFKNLSNSIYAAENVQKYLDEHYKSFVQVLETKKLNIVQAHKLHKFLGAKKSKLIDSREHFTGKSYGEIFYSSQHEGKQLEAFFNHVAKYNPLLFNALGKNIKTEEIRTILLGLDKAHNFNSIFENTYEIQNLLYNSLNSAAWYTGGDIIVTDNLGRILYNIQLKSSVKGKTFGIALDALQTFAEELKTIYNNGETEVADLLYKRLKTSSATELQRLDKILEEQIFDEVRKNLKLI